MESHFWPFHFRVSRAASRLSAGRWHGPCGAPSGGRRGGYLLLETVVATGLLVVGLAVIGAQFQDATLSVKQMERRLQAMSLAERQLGELDLGLVELDSVDQVQEEEFGPRYPDWGWRLTIDDTAIEGMFSLTLEILYHRAEDRKEENQKDGDKRRELKDSNYSEGDFDFDNAETLYTVFAFRPAPMALNLVDDFGLPDDEIDEISDQLSELGIPGLDPLAIDPGAAGKLDYEEFLRALPVLLRVFGLELGDLTSALPPDLLEELRDSGLLEELGGDGGGDGS